MIYYGFRNQVDKMMETQVVRKSKTNTLVKVALLSAVATLIMFVEFVVPLMPVFLKIDLSEIPVLLGTFALGPVAGIVIELIKNLIHLPMSSTAGIGEIANFLVGVAFVVPAGAAYQWKKNRMGAFIGLAVGTICMTAVAAVLNYYMLIPLYQTVLHMPLDAIIGMGTKGNKAIIDLKTLIVLGIIPFNLIKAVIVSFVTLLIYKKLSPILHR